MDFTVPRATWGGTAVASPKDPAQGLDFGDISQGEAGAVGPQSKLMVSGLTPAAS